MSAAEVGLPMRFATPGLPEAVTIYEVGPRDGLQNEKTVVPLEVKAEFVTRLLDAGLPVVEATSFVHPRWVPQLADAAELMTELAERLCDRARDRKSTRLNSSHVSESRMPSSA